MVLHTESGAKKDPTEEDPLKTVIHKKLRWCLDYEQSKHSRTQYARRYVAQQRWTTTRYNEGSQKRKVEICRRDLFEKYVLEKKDWPKNKNASTAQLLMTELGECLFEAKATLRDPVAAEEKKKAKEAKNLAAKEVAEQKKHERCQHEQLRLGRSAAKMAAKTDATDKEILAMGAQRMNERAVKEQAASKVRAAQEAKNSEKYEEKLRDFLRWRLSPAGKKFDLHPPPDAPLQTRNSKRFTCLENVIDLGAITQDVMLVLLEYLMGSIDESGQALESQLEAEALILGCTPKEVRIEIGISEGREVQTRLYDCALQLINEKVVVGKFGFVPTKKTREHTLHVTACGRAQDGITYFQANDKTIQCYNPLPDQYKQFEGTTHACNGEIMEANPQVACDYKVMHRLQSNNLDATKFQIGPNAYQLVVNAEATQTFAGLLKKLQPESMMEAAENAAQKSYDARAKQHRLANTASKVQKESTIFPDEKSNYETTLKMFCESLKAVRVLEQKAVAKKMVKFGYDIEEFKKDVMDLSPNLEEFMTRLQVRRLRSSWLEQDL